MSIRVGCAFMLLCSMGVACGTGNSADSCTKDSDCASNFCKLDGTCGPAPVDGAVGGDGMTDGMSALCNANHDGTISLSELPFVAGKMGTFRVALDATWNTAGTSAASGSRSWDLSTQLSGDNDKLLMLAPPTDQWWAGDFPGASYATELSVESDLKGVFKVTASSLTLLGVVSPDSGLYKTELIYDTPIEVLALPLTAGASWTTTSTVTGYLDGVYGIKFETEEYESRVDQVGTMKTPYGDFPVLRVATDLTRTSGITTLLRKRTFSWIAECFGPVANAAAQDNVTSTEFSDNAEIRRLVP